MAVIESTKAFYEICHITKPVLAPPLLTSHIRRVMNSELPFYSSAEEKFSYSPSPPPPPDKR